MKYIRTFDEEIPNLLPHQAHTPKACFSKKLYMGLINLFIFLQYSHADFTIETSSLIAIVPFKFNKTL